ncbi:MAG: hypothetical protein HO274_06270 [Ferrovum myxofaciens]|jgi:DNA-binding CsgD family transcriptional regulator|uniref:LuxR C-terminal-related transcriptional regulator n=1 Tax=Ferrovum myxofaciens TaxID=416213 RepID=UPI0023551B96|nr:LuxR C-terminal-related transcriptional regulator [Ferrovum myxofaciens]QKE40954.1 MAG: hypothetical protein HO274_06270 [Ferrovum myxofaciens]
MRTYISAKDYRSLLTLINQLYTLPDQETIIRAVIEELGKLVPFSSAIFIAMEASGLFRPDGHFSVAIPPKALSEFTNHYAAVHPFTLTGWIRHTNESARITDFVPAYRLQDTEYGRDFLPLTPCFYELGVIMGAQGDHVGAFCLHRQKMDRDFSDREVQILNYLVPHMARAINCLQLLERLNAGGFSSETGVVRMLVDGGVTMNEAARKISLEHLDRVIPNRFTESGASILESPKGRYRIQTTSSNQGSERILLFEPLPFTETLFQRLCRWDFTDRQAEIVLKVIRGASNREIAVALSVSEQTVKEHLRNIFEKVKVRRRSELISRILSDS